ncbi:inositol monophosphatase family protein [Phytoactinopolyspora limicola]|uniref:inositol monophosphatase family protein n=1 Tax=Phytoactinopolyspora limicola TaxID=2715536 RepID=UPI00140B548E|nr:inositol monophosphatase family protein [Phytoactinopolyspora limicola]
MSELRDLSQHLSDVAGQAAQAVAGQLRTAFRQEMEVDYKRDNHDLVTKYDRLAEDRIREVLLASVPDSVVVGEERGAEGDGDIRWYVDPIDGTANFVSGFAFFCTSIGAVVGNEIVAGAVLDPMADHLFTADLAGAYLNGARLNSGGVSDEAHALLISAYPTARDLDRDGPVALERLGELIDTYSSVRRPGSAALTLSHVAAGWVDAAFGTAVNPWDVAAGILLVRRAGGSYRPLGAAADTPVWAAPAYMASTRALEPKVLDRIAGYVGETVGGGE